jgi:hypothetical protein
VEIHVEDSIYPSCTVEHKGPMALLADARCLVRQTDKASEKLEEVLQMLSLKALTPHLGP